MISLERLRLEKSQRIRIELFSPRRLGHQPLDLARADRVATDGGDDGARIGGENATRGGDASDIPAKMSRWKCEDVESICRVTSSFGAASRPTSPFAPRKHAAFAERKATM